MVTGIRFALLGPVRAWRGETELKLGHPQQRAVLTGLLLGEGASRTLDELADIVWGDDPPATALSTIRTHVHRLRQAIGDDLIRSSGGGYQLVLDPDAVDVVRFRRLISQAEAARRTADPALAETLLAEALALWTGTALAGIPGPAAAAERMLLGELRLAAVEEHLVCGLDLGRHAEAAAELTYLVATHPLRERLRELLMIALYGAGRQADALAVFDDTRRILRDELGIDPAPRLQDVHRRILQADPELRPTSRATELRREPVPLVRPAQLPAGLAHFAGRGDDLDLLRAAPAPSAVVIDGMAGIGKTSLALHWAHEVAPGFADGQLYFNLRGFEADGRAVDTAEVLGEFLQAFGVAVPDIPSGLSARAAFYRSLLAGRRVLVVLDNARDSAQVKPLLPGSADCLAVITSRNELPDLVAAYGARPLSLRLPSADEAHEYLVRVLGPQRVEAAPDAVAEIIECCGRLPLALAVVAARAAQRPAFPLAAIAGELRAAHGGLDAFSGRSVDARAIFSWSYEALRPDEARLFRLLALHPGPDVTVAAAASLIALPPLLTRELLAGLSTGHLLTEHLPGRYTTHDLLRAYAGSLNEGRTDGSVATRRMLDHYLRTAHAAARSFSVTLEPIPLPSPAAGVLPEPITGHEQAAQWLAAEQPVLVAAVLAASARGFDTHAWQLAWALEDFLDHRGRWHDLAATQRTALKAGRRLGDPFAQAHAHRGLARAEANLRRYESARAHAERALRRFDESTDATMRAESHRMISWLLGQSSYDDALTHAEQALALHSTTGDKKRQVIALSSVGWCHTLLGRHREALTYGYQALDTAKEVACPVGLADTWVSLGHAHHHLDEHSSAIAAYERALDLYRQVGFSHPEANTLTRLGDVLLAAEQPHPARVAWTEALGILTELGHSDTGSLRARLEQV